MKGHTMTINKNPGSPNEEQQKQVDAEIDKLSNTCGRCGAALNELEQCLERSVLREHPPVDGAQGISPITPLVPVAARIRESTWDVQSMTEKIQSIMDRIEV